MSICLNCGGDAGQTANYCRNCQEIRDATTVAANPVKSISGEEYQENVRRQEECDRSGRWIMAVFYLLCLGGLLGILYALVRFVKWAWTN